MWGHLMRGDQFMQVINICESLKNNFFNDQKGFIYRICQKILKQKGKNIHVWMSPHEIWYIYKAFSPVHWEARFLGSNDNKLTLQFKDWIGLWANSVYNIELTGNIPNFVKYPKMGIKSCQFGKTDQVGDTGFLSLIKRSRGLTEYNIHLGII